MSASGARLQVVALDVGGSAMKGAVLDEHGATSGFRRWHTPRCGSPEAIVTAVLTAVDELLQEANGAVAVGLVVPGLVDEQEGIALHSENLGWRDVHFRRLVVERSGLPVAFGHDVRAGGLAERVLGAARGIEDVLFLPIGTGISGAMYIAGELNTNMYAGEIGHIDIGSGEPCACGAHGCLETVASGAAIAKHYNQAANGSAVGAHEVLKLMIARDPIAIRIWDEAVEALARALATYTSLLAPDLIVIGGGVSRAGEALLGPIRARLRELLVWQKEPRVLAALLGENAACLGAGLLARQIIEPDFLSKLMHITGDKVAES